MTKMSTFANKVWKLDFKSFYSTNLSPDFTAIYSALEVKYEKTVFRDCLIT